MERFLQALAKAADGAFVVDNAQHIIFWNSAAEILTGFAEDELLGRSCFTILGGVDEEGRLICRAQCWVAAEGLSGRPISSFDTAIRTKSTGIRWVNMSTFTYPVGDDDDHLLVHLFRDATRTKQRDQFIRELQHQMERLHGGGRTTVTPSSVASQREPLTPREREILSLLVQGHSTRDMAQTLVISASTVRNHIRHILSKLGVHSRLEAVAFAIRHGLADLPDME